MLVLDVKYQKLFILKSLNKKITLRKKNLYYFHEKENTHCLAFNCRQYSHDNLLRDGLACVLQMRRRRAMSRGKQQLPEYCQVRGNRHHDGHRIFHWQALYLQA